MKRPEKKLVLESGEEFTGVGFGSTENRVCEIVFNTSVVGYQEIISDPCYAGKFIVMISLFSIYSINYCVYASLASITNFKALNI